MITWFLSKKKNVDRNTKKGGDDFVSLSSHELRSPLSIIKWYTEILLDGDAGPLTEDQRKYLTVIESSNQRAIDLVRSLLNVSRLDLGTFSILPEDVSPQAILQESVSTLTQEASKRNVEIVIEDSLPKDTSLVADKRLVGMIIKNVIANAIVFSKEGGKVMVSLSDLPLGKEVKGKVINDESFLISVRDQGIGIPLCDQSKVFSKMFRAGNVKESNGTGSGLGLYIVKSILNHAGGEIWFSSEENVGSTFFVTFPKKGMKKKEGRTTLD